MPNNIHDVNGLLFWSEHEIQFRNHAVAQLASTVHNSLWAENQAWVSTQIEGTTLVPRDIISTEYTDGDVWVQDSQGGTPLVLRPETTPSTYAYAEAMFTGHTPYKPPVCFWQLGKSFRREQDQPTKFMRLKEFYQLEFQCIYTADTHNDYRTPVLAEVAMLVKNLTGVTNDEIQIIPSDRIPAYAESTMDIEVIDRQNDRWMEVCSASIRTDFPIPYTFSTKKGKVEKNLKVLEIALGMDRLTYLRGMNG